ncbi:MurR/RpiR family transcriptional regulator [Enterococcus sp. HY326]|uniref:MurR/RpiR family transcriptional regulator n=1 Tax=Enterococcus sp. HY326 TaxID=2971265 RepID=UPI002240D800|nr:MurR/RpiR family transcriptional regulator [Enterococcus sp. HY326]
MMFNYDKIKHLSELEIIIYNYIIDHPNDILNMSIQELANKTHVSTTTILRFCRSLGLKGYAEFKLHYKDYLANENSVAADFPSTDISYLERYITLEFQEKLSEIAAVIKKSSGIVWMGFGASAGICRYAASYFANTGKTNLVIDDPYFHSQDSLFDNSVLIVLSVSGEIDNTIRILQNLKQSQNQIISITNYDNSTLAKLSDYVLAYYIPYSKSSEIDMTTQLPVMFIIEMLCKKIIGS